MKTNKKDFTVFQIVGIILCVHLILFTFFVTMNNIINNKGGAEMDLLETIGISLLCSAISSIVVSAFFYFKFLKDIPTETKNKVDELLNLRLNYETTNHNAAIAEVTKARTELQTLLQPDNRTIYDKVDAIHIQVVTKKDKQDDVYNNLFSSGQRAIINAVNSLSDFADIMVDVQAQNNKLSMEVEELRDKLRTQRNNNKHENQAHQYEYDR